MDVGFQKRLRSRFLMRAIHQNPQRAGELVYFLSNKWLIKGREIFMWNQQLIWGLRFQLHLKWGMGID